MKRVRILVNKRSGFMWSFESVKKALDTHWSEAGYELSYAFCTDPMDGRLKAAAAVEDGCDILLVVGGDGTVSTAGAALIGSETALAAIPVGSGNGFARHFGVPLRPEDAVKSLADGEVHRIDVGYVDEKPFVVTCSMAWDAALVRTFDKFPVRGVVPYLFAGVYELFEYKAQRIRATIDSGEVLEFDEPIVFTVANLSQFGGGAVIAPQARHDDGHLELVVACRQDIPVLIANVVKMFQGEKVEMSSLVHRKFSSLKVEREHAAPIQMDGELVDSEGNLSVTVSPGVLKVIMPGER